MSTEVDFGAKKTEAEWQRTIDAFALAATPVWFDWLGWVLIMGALRYLQVETGSVAAGIALGVSGGLFTIYFYSYFYQFTFKNLPFMKSKGAVRLASFVVSAALGIGTQLLLRSLITALGATKA